MARRLVEAGARVVTISFGRWDTHSQQLRDEPAAHPQARHGPVGAGRGPATTAGSTRTSRSSSGASSAARPKINKNAGRDHWPPVNFALLAGGGMRTGQVIGATDKQGAYVTDRPVAFQNVFATLYHNLGIDPATAVSDRSGRPMYLLDEREPIRELI